MICDSEFQCLCSGVNKKDNQKRYLRLPIQYVLLINIPENQNPTFYIYIQIAILHGSIHSSVITVKITPLASLL